MNEFLDFALSEFSGCDFNDNEISQGAIWLMGVEHGSPKWSEVERSGGDDMYSIEEQKKYPFNRKAFKLLSSMFGYGVSNWEEFATQHKPFVKGVAGFFKGNIYPYPCRSVKDWSEQAKHETGFNTKSDYIEWCQANRFAVLRSWVENSRPRLIVATGFSHKNEFAQCLMNSPELKRVEFSYSGSKSLHFFCANSSGLVLVVIPHLSGSRLWASDLSLQAAGRQSLVHIPKSLVILYIKRHRSIAASW